MGLGFDLCGDRAQEELEKVELSLPRMAERV